MQHHPLFTTILLGFVFLHATAQNKVGIGTDAPQYTLDVRGINQCFGQFKAADGYAGVVLDKSAEINNAYVVYRTGGLDKWTAGTMSDNNFSIYNWNVAGEAVTIGTHNNFVGLGASNPGFRLDVGGRMRLRTGDGSAGLWLNNMANTGAVAFVGVLNDNHIGFWGNTGIGWSLLMNTDNGFLGVKNGNPQSDLHVIHGLSSGAQNGIRLQNAGANNQQWALYVVNSTGNLELYHNGGARGIFNEGSGTYNAVSDARLKKDIQTSEDVLGNIMKLGVKKYQFIQNETNRKYYGLIAQEVEKLFPELVYHNHGDDGKEYYTMDYGAVGVIAIKGIQELQPMFDKQQAEIKQLQQQNERLRQELAELKQAVTKLSGD
jgi:hypothetical protein